MHPSNIMWLLNELDCNSNVRVKYSRSKAHDYVEIHTDDFSFYCDEYGYHTLTYYSDLSKGESDIKIWKLVKAWIVKYTTEVLAE